MLDEDRLKSANKYGPWAFIGTVVICITFLLPMSGILPPEYPPKPKTGSFDVEFSIESREFISQFNFTMYEFVITFNKVERPISLEGITMSFADNMVYWFDDYYGVTYNSTLGCYIVQSENDYLRAYVKQKDLLQSGDKIVIKRPGVYPNQNVRIHIVINDIVTKIEFVLPSPSEVRVYNRVIFFD